MRCDECEDCFLAWSCLEYSLKCHSWFCRVSISMSFAYEGGGVRWRSSRHVLLPPQSGKGFICQQGCISLQGMWKMVRVSYSSRSPAGNNPEITCRDDALMILLMKKPGLSSAATDWKEPASVQCNGPSLDNPSESMQSMRPPIWSWNVRGCHVWHLLEHWLWPNRQNSGNLSSSIF